MNVMFMGTPEFSVECLEKLIEDGHNVKAVVSQADKPKGRGHKLVPTPVKECALKHGIEVYQPESLKEEEFSDILRKVNPDIIIAVAYGKILPEYILEYPEYKCVNVHASLLPKYRGAGPIQWCLINGEKTTGVTTMYMEKGLDTGDMLLKEETLIEEYENCESLYLRLSHMGAELLSKTLKGLEEGSIVPEKQNDAESSYAPMISKETGRIDWNKNAKEISDLIRGTYVWPVAHTLFNGEPMKIYSAKVGENKEKACPGTILSAKKVLEIQCGEGTSLIVEEAQFFGGKRMSIESYLNGHNIDTGIILGN